MKTIKKIRVPIIIITTLIVIISFFQTVNAREIYSLSTTSNKGGFVETDTSLVSGDNDHVLIAKPNNGYYFDCWEIDGEYSYLWGAAKDTRVEINISTNCVAKAIFKPIHNIENNTESNSYNEESNNKKYYSSNPVKKMAYKIDQEENKKSNNTTARIIAVICFVVVVLMFFSFGIKSIKLLIKIKQRKRK